MSTSMQTSGRSKGEKGRPLSLGPISFIFIQFWYPMFNVHPTHVRPELTQKALLVKEPCPLSNPPLLLTHIKRRLLRMH